MKITITCPIPEKGLEAGKTYEVSDLEAAQYTAEEKAIEIVSIDATAIADEKPVFIESAKPKKVKHDNG